MAFSISPTAFMASGGVGEAIARILAQGARIPGEVQDAQFRRRQLDLEERRLLLAEQNAKSEEERNRIRDAQARVQWEKSFGLQERQAASVDADRADRAEDRRDLRAMRAEQQQAMEADRAANLFEKQRALAAEGIPILPDNVESRYAIGSVDPEDAGPVAVERPVRDVFRETGDPRLVAAFLGGEERRRRDAELKAATAEQEHKYKLAEIGAKNAGKAVSQPKNLDDAAWRDAVLKAEAAGIGEINPITQQFVLVPGREAEWDAQLAASVASVRRAGEGGAAQKPAPGTGPVAWSVFAAAGYNRNNPKHVEAAKKAAGARGVDMDR